MSKVLSMFSISLQFLVVRPVIGYHKSANANNIPELTIGGNNAADIATPINEANEDPTAKTDIPTPKPDGIAINIDVKIPLGVPRLIISYVGQSYHPAAFA